MASLAIQDHILRPTGAASTRILFVARHAPDEPSLICRSFPGDGGYPAYYHRVCHTLIGLGYRLRTANHPLALYSAGASVDLVFSLYNRMRINNPEIFVASTCEFLRLPSVGARPNIRALAEDKWFSKMAARAAGLPVAEGAVYDDEASLSRPPSFPGPYFVKHRFGAASDGVTEQSIQEDWAGAARIARGLLAQGVPVLVERFCPGIDLAVPVLGGVAPLVLGVVKPGSNKEGGIITEDLKRDDPLGYELYDDGALHGVLAADMRALWDAAGPMDYFRADYRFDPATGQRVFLEFNICCHIGRSGAVCLAASQWGLSQADVLGHVVEYSLKRQAGLKEGGGWA